MESKDRRKVPPKGHDFLTSFVDTNVVVRYLIGDNPELARRAARIIHQAKYLLIPPEVLTETAYVLSSVYQVPRETIVDKLIDLIQRENISMFGVGKGLIVHGLLLCRPSRRVSFSDAIIWASARAAGAKVIYSFDQRFPCDGLEIRQEP